MILIDKEAFIKEFDNRCRGECCCCLEVTTSISGCKVIDEAPVIDAVPVVMCKDCQWWERIDNGLYGYCHACKHSFYSSNWEISIYRRYKEDWFCADGEREQK